MSGPYSIILADPPWRFNNVRGDGILGRAMGSSRAYYDLMRTEDIAALPVQSLAAKDCALFLWGTWPLLPDVLKVVEAWGFKYKTCGFLWVKTTRNLFNFHVGLGYWTRANTEYCLLATRGTPKRVNKAVRQLVLAPVREHSRKPDEVHHKIVDLMGDLPRVELFARRPAEGWDVWGNQVEGISLPELERAA
jgi:site-specific DNA-methyltransferase (adenine-specific)